MHVPHAAKHAAWCQQSHWRRRPSPKRADARKRDRLDDGSAKEAASGGAGASARRSDDPGTRADNPGFARAATELLRESASAGHGRDGTVYTGWLGQALVWLRVNASPAFACSSLARGGSRTEGGAVSEAARAAALAESELHKSRRRDVSLLMGRQEDANSLYCSNAVVFARQGCTCNACHIGSASALDHQTTRSHSLMPWSSHGRGGLVGMRMSLMVANGDVEAARKLGETHLVGRNALSVLREVLVLPNRDADEVLYGRCG